MDWKSPDTWFHILAVLAVALHIFPPNTIARKVGNALGRGVGGGGPTAALLLAAGASLFSLSARANVGIPDPQPSTIIVQLSAAMKAADCGPYTRLGWDGANARLMKCTSHVWAAFSGASGTTTNHATVIGRGATTGFASVGPCTDGQVQIGATGADPTCRTLSSAVSAVSATGAVTLATVGVATGGTGATTLTDHGIVLASGTSPLRTLTCTNGQTIVGQTGADPACANLSGPITLSSTGATQVTTTGDGASGLTLWITKDVADSAGGATTNVTVPQKCEVVTAFAIKGGTGGAAGDTVQLKRHSDAGAITPALDIGVAAFSQVLPATIDTTKTTIDPASDSLDVVQAAHATNNGARVVIQCIRRL